MKYGGPEVREKDYTNKCSQFFHYYLTSGPPAPYSFSISFQGNLYLTAGPAVVLSPPFPSLLSSLAATERSLAAIERPLKPSRQLSVSESVNQSSISPSCLNAPVWSWVGSEAARSPREAMRRRTFAG